MSHEKNLTIQLLEIEILADFVMPKAKRKRKKTTPFKVLNAIFIMTMRNAEKGNEFTFPSKELISDMAKVSRSEVTRFICSDQCKEFCDIKRRKLGNGKNTTNVYFLKDWVFQWFRLFYRSGMMKGMLDCYTSWLAKFKKRVSNWLLPLVEGGLSVDRIYQGVIDKLSTKTMLKRAVDEPLKRAAMKSSSKSSLSLNTSRQAPDFSFFERREDRHANVDRILLGFKLTYGDLTRLRSYHPLDDLERIADEVLKWNHNSPPKSPVGAIKGMIDKLNIRQSRY